jgi:methionine synthase I (cobalamin-dependent)
MDELAWSATALLTHPEVIREIHEDYITSGADIITTNTFGTLGLSLRSTTLANRVSEANRTAVRLAQKAWGFDSVISPMEFATAAESWVARGVQVIGGCCGIGPDHIRLLRDRFEDKRVPVRSR